MATTMISRRNLFEVVYILSGLTALVYQVVWQRLLTLNYGVGAVSVSVIVSVFLLGLGLGAEAGGRLATTARSPARAYAIIELIIGAFGVASLPFLAVLAPLLASAHPLVAAATVILFLLVPTLCMGATFPLITRAFTAFDPAVAMNVSRLYFLNTMGAAVGAVLASYLLASLAGLRLTIHLVAATNLLLGLAVLAAGSPGSPGTASTPASVPPGPSNVATSFRIPLLLVGAGFLAIAYQMVWFRWITVLTKDSPYAFSSTLGVYLAGLALGSRFMSSRMKSLEPESAEDLFGWLQFFLALTALAGVVLLRRLATHPATAEHLMLAFMHPAHPPPWDPTAWPPDVLRTCWGFTTTFLWPALLFLPATLLMGACFPVAARMRADLEKTAGAVVGRVYLLTVLGNVAGGLVTGLLLLHALGSETTVTLLVAVGLFFPASRLAAAPDRNRRLGATLGALASLALLHPRPGEMILALHPRPTQIGTEVNWMEGVEGTVVTFPAQDRILNYINGQLHGGYPNLKMYRKTIETMVLAPRLDDVLVIGFGTGSNMEMLLQSPEVKQVRLVEINATLLANLSRFPVFERILKDPRLETILDDARRRLLIDGRRFDVLMMDPLRTTTVCSNNLYSKEFFELARSRLAPDGVLMVWLDEHRVLPRTVATVFDHVRQYDFFLIASMSPILERPERRTAVESLLNPGIRSLLDRHIPINLVGDREHVLQTTQGAPINTDLDPVTEYYLGLPWRDSGWRPGGS